MVFFIAILGALISGIVAAGKNRNAIGWGALGFCLPLIGVIVACCLEEGTKPQEQQS
jgi:hypothetical protein